MLEIFLPYAKKVKDLMLPPEDYPHIPYWFTLRQAMAIVREEATKITALLNPGRYWYLTKNTNLWAS